MKVDESEKQQAQFLSVYGQMQKPSSFNVLKNQIRKQKNKRELEIEQQFLQSID